VREGGCQRGDKPSTSPRPEYLPSSDFRQHIAMLTEEFVSATRGPPLTTNTAFVKDAGIFTYSLNPNVKLKSTFKKSSAPPNCLAVSDTHVFSAQHEKAYVHVYSRLKGNQEAFIPFPERIHCVTLVGDVLLLGTAEGRLCLWEVSQTESLLMTFSMLMYAQDLHRKTSNNTSSPYTSSLSNCSNISLRPDGLRRLQHPCLVTLKPT
jgi:hypothetical protein